MTRKKRSAANSLLPEEDKEEQGRFAEALRERLRPGGAAERALAARITELAWRLQRAGRHEAALVRAAPAEE